MTQLAAKQHAGADATAGQERCPECGTPLDEIPLDNCATHRAYDATYDATYDDGQPDEQQEWADYDRDC